MSETTPQPPTPATRISSCRILWSTQSGRAKACARRTARILGERTGVTLEGGIGSPFDETPVPLLELLAASSAPVGNNNDNGDDDSNNNDGTLFLMFVSTTGDGEHCDSIRQTWRSLLKKTLPNNLLAGTTSSSNNNNNAFAMFCLGDRAYGPQFCAAGRKLAARLLQLGMPSLCGIGYGDDNTPSGGVFRDLDGWLEDVLLPGIVQKVVVPLGEAGGGPTASSPLLALSKRDNHNNNNKEHCPFLVQVVREKASNGVNDAGSDEQSHDNQSTKDRDERVGEDPPPPATIPEWKRELFKDSYRDYFTERGPATAYSYDDSRGERIATTTTAGSNKHGKATPWIGTVTRNERITDPDWKQDTRHIEIELELPEPESKITGTGTSDTTAPNEEPSTPLPYLAGDVVSVLPFNSAEEVNRFLGVLPDSLSSMADSVLRIDVHESCATDNRYTLWPRYCTLRGWLTHCADIQSLPEREDLRALSVYCAPRNNNSNNDDDFKDDDADRDSAALDQGHKLRSLSETSEAALYADYILREKRSWTDVLHDFESLRAKGSLLTLGALLMLLPPMRARDFSIASSPSMGKVLAAKKRENGESSDSRRRKGGCALPETSAVFSVDLCVAVVEGTTRLGRRYHGLCSKFLSGIEPSRAATAGAPLSSSGTCRQQLRVWIKPGTFGKMPMRLASDNPSSFEVPIVCVGAGTGIAPMRSLLLERVAVRSVALLQRASEDDDCDARNDAKTNRHDDTVRFDKNDNVLVFGCRKQTADYYYKTEWQALGEEKNIRLLTAFSQDQLQKIYVQKVLRDADDGAMIAKHVLERGGAVFVAGNPKMARAVKQEIVEALAFFLPEGETQAKKILSKMQRIGRFGIEAWS